jgi:type I restriction enzyme S subunit
MITNPNLTATEQAALPPGWVETSLGEVAQLLRGVTYKKTEAGDQPRPGYLPILRATNIRDEGLTLDAELVYVPQKYVKPEQRLRPGDVVICLSSGSRQLVGKAAQLVAEWPGSFGAFCAVARCKPGVEPKFVGYFFRSTRYRKLIQAKSAGININNLRYADLGSLPVPLPALAEQQRIVAAIERSFTRLDTGVAALQRVQVKLRHYKTAVLNAAAAGRLVPQDATDESASYLLRRLRTEVESPLLFPEALSLPTLPPGWCWANLAAISDVLAGYAFKSSDYSQEGFQLVKIGNVGRGHLNLAEKPTFISSVEAKIEEKYLLHPGDLVITLTGTRRQRDYGCVALIQNERGLLLNQRVARLRFQPPLNPKFFWIALQSEDFQNRFFQYETGNVGQGNVRIAAITREAVPVPPLAEQARIVAEVERRLAVAGQLEAAVTASLKRAERLCQAILARAFAGRLG